MVADEKRSLLPTLQPTNFREFVKLNLTALNALASCAAYMAAGPLLIMVNAQLLKKHNFAYPLLISGQGLAVTGVVSAVVVNHGPAWTRSQDDIRSLVDRRFFFKRILPVGCFAAGTFYAGNATYLYLSVSFIQMLKAFTPIVVGVVLQVLGVQRLNVQQKLVLLVISVSTALTTWHSPNVDLRGVLLCLLAEVCEGSRLALVQMLMQSNRLSVFESGYYISSTTAIMLLCCSLFFELPLILSKPAQLSLISAQWHLFLLSATLGVCVNLAGFWCIQSVGAIILKCLGIVRTAALILFCVVFMGEEASVAQVISYGISLAAFGVYTFLPQINSWWRRRRDLRAPGDPAPSPG